MTTPAQLFRVLTHTDRARLAILYSYGISCRTAPGLLHGRTVARTVVAGPTFHCRTVLAKYGFVWSPKRRTWTAFGIVDLATLLPELIAAHEAGEAADQRPARQHEMNRKASLDMVARLGRGERARVV